MLLIRSVIHKAIKAQIMMAISRLLNNTFPLHDLYLLLRQLIQLVLQTIYLLIGCVDLTLERFFLVRFIMLPARSLGNQFPRFHSSRLLDSGIGFHEYGALPIISSSCLIHRETYHRKDRL